LPREASVGFVTGATMAGFVSLAAARSEVLKRAGHDFEAHGLQGAPVIKVFLSDDVHITNISALRYIGLGEANLVRVASDNQGCMRIPDLAAQLEAHPGPKIIIAQAGHINSGAFEDFGAISRLSRHHGAWLHVDGAFGLWARATRSRFHLTKDVDLADSWSADGHKWLQIPYDSGFAIVKNKTAHQRAMDISAEYLNSDPADGRNPTHFNPELSRRARGFAAWTAFQSLGRAGIRNLIETHCDYAAQLGHRLSTVKGLKLLNEVYLNQIIVADADLEQTGRILRLADQLNASGKVFVRPAHWYGREILRISITGAEIEGTQTDSLYEAIVEAWEAISS
ncbi:MAG: pyridoxal-dependent decarboxylase, partial [Pseudomonadota bacterium]